MKEGAVFNVNYTDRYTQVIGLPRNILVKIYLLDKMLQRVHLYGSQHAAELLACHSHIHALQSVVRTDVFCFHGLSWQNNVDLFVFVL
jgi:hypothetical protein